ncbi:MAG: hypothetical protein ACR2P0_04935 [Acidimicrobiales bacterium]
MVKRLFIIALIGIVIASIVKKAQTDRSQWEGLTEQEVRDRLSERIPGRVPEEKRDLIADKVVGKMRDKGALVDDDADVITLTKEAEPAGA